MKEELSDIEILCLTTSRELRSIHAAAEELKTKGEESVREAIREARKNIDCYLASDEDWATQGLSYAIELLFLSGDAEEPLLRSLEASRRVVSFQYPDFILNFLQDLPEIKQDETAMSVIFAVRDKLEDSPEPKPSRRLCPKPYGSNAGNKLGY